MYLYVYGLNHIFLYIFLFVQMICSVIAQETTIRVPPSIYRWIEENAHVCTIIPEEGKTLIDFMTENEAKTCTACPLVGFREIPVMACAWEFESSSNDANVACHEIPHICIQELLTQHSDFYLLNPVVNTHSTMSLIENRIKEDEPFTGFEENLNMEMMATTTTSTFPPTTTTQPPFTTTQPAFIQETTETEKEFGDFDKFFGPFISDTTGMTPSMELLTDIPATTTTAAPRKMTTKQLEHMPVHRFTPKFIEKTMGVATLIHRIRPTTRVFELTSTTKPKMITTTKTAGPLFERVTMPFRSFSTKTQVPMNENRQFLQSNTLVEVHPSSKEHEYQYSHENSREINELAHGQIKTPGKTSDNLVKEKAMENLEMRSAHIDTSTTTTTTLKTPKFSKTPDITVLENEQHQKLVSNVENCKDTNDLCCFWAVNGECSQNPMYMHVNCAKACGTCHCQAHKSENCASNGINCNIAESLSRWEATNQKSSNSAQISNSRQNVFQQVEQFEHLYMEPVQQPTSISVNIPQLLPITSIKITKVEPIEIKYRDEITQLPPTTTTTTHRIVPSIRADISSKSKLYEKNFKAKNMYSIEKGSEKTDNVPFKPKQIYFDGNSMKWKKNIGRDIPIWFLIKPSVKVAESYNVELQKDEKLHKKMSKFEKYSTPNLSHLHIPDHFVLHEAKLIQVAHPECFNYHRLCAFWAKMGECDSNPFWMRPHCQESCKSCGETLDSVYARKETNGCVNEHKLCQYWWYIGECQTNPKYMLKKCKLSCNVCWVKNETKFSKNN